MRIHVLSVPLICLLAACSADQGPLPARCSVDPGSVDFGTTLPPPTAIPLSIDRTLVVANDPETTGPAGNRDLGVSLSIEFDAPQSNPPQVAIVLPSSGTDFRIPPRESREVLLRATVSRTTSTGPYSGTLSLGTSCSDIPFVLSVEAVQEEPPVFLREWGAAGSAPGELDQPHSIALAPDGTVYLTDRGNERVQAFDAAGTYRWSWNEWLDSFKPPDQARTFFSVPTGIAVDGAGEVFVADIDPKGKIERVTQFDAHGNYLYRWGPNRDGTSIFSGIRGLVVDPDQHILVLDYVLPRIFKFELVSEHSGYLTLAEWGSAGDGPGRFDLANRIGVDPGDGSVYVSDNARDTIQKFNNFGNFLLQWGGTGTAPGKFRIPSGIAVDRSGDVYVADTGNVRIQKFDRNGAFLTAWGIPGTSPGRLEDPVDVAVDGAGVVYVLDSTTDRVIEFSPDQAAGR